MSLIVWIPGTDGTLKNQGLSNITPSCSSLSANSSGKLGNCVKVSASADTGLTYDQWNFRTTNIAFGGWVKFVSSEINSAISGFEYTSKYNSAGGSLFGYDNYGGASIFWQTNNIYSSGSLSSISLIGTLRSNSGSAYTTSSYTITFGEWVHVMYIIDRTNNKLLLYINGNLVGSGTTFDSSIITEVNTSNFKLNTATWPSGNGQRVSVPIYYNDVRLYAGNIPNASEVKEISKGLVCHYTLSDLSIVNKNLLGEDSIPIDTKVTVGLWYTSFKDSSDFFGLLAGDTFSVSCYVTCPAAKGATLRIQYYTDGNNRISVYGTTIAAGLSGLLTYTGTLTAEQRAYTKMLITILNSNTSVTTNDDFYVRALKIEKFNSNTAYTTSSTTSIIYDSSGYCNNGTISGNPSLDLNTSRYNKALLFPANSTSTITTPLSIDPNAWTISFWEKCDWTNVETSSPLIVRWGYYVIIRKLSTYGRMIALYYYKDSEGTQTNILLYFMNAIGTDTSWKHFALTFDGSTLKTYLNGTLNASANLSSGFSLYDINGNFILNYTAETIPKSLSDVRVYATALSADDVLELYNLGLQ